MHKHIRGSALLASMLITAVVSGAVVYNLEHSLFETALQENYALYQKEFAAQKLALDTLRLKNNLATDDTPGAGSFCSPGNDKLVSYPINQTTALRVEPTYTHELNIDTTDKPSKRIDAYLSWNAALSAPFFSTTSLPSISVLSIKPLNGLTEFAKRELHYIDTTAATALSVETSYQTSDAALIITDAARAISRISYDQKNKAIMLGTAIAYLPNLPEQYHVNALEFAGVDTTLATLYFSARADYFGSDAETANKKPIDILLAFNVKTKKIIKVSEFKNLLQ